MSELNDGNIAQGDGTNWRVRASACELLSFTLRYPDRALVDALASGEWDDAAMEILNIAGMTLDSPMEPTHIQDSEMYLCELRTEATRLFVGAPHASVSPYEGVWRAQHEGVDPFVFVNPHSMDVERFVKACGLERAGNAIVPFDHVSTEFEILEYLAAVAASIVDVNSYRESQEKFPGGSAAAAFEIFFNEHARTWMGDFSNHLVKMSRLPIYRNAARVIKAFVR